MEVLSMNLTANFVKSLSGLLLVSVLGATLVSPVMAEQKYKRVLDASTQQYYYVPETSVKQKTKNAFGNPIVKQSAIGAGVGAAAGAFSDKTSALKGAGIGAVVGAGTGLIDKSSMLQGKPMVKNALKGAAIGTGASAVMDKSKLKGAAAGAAAGAGFQLIKDYMNKDTNTGN